MAEGVLLKDALFNPETVGQLAEEYASGIAGFDAGRFTRDALAGFPDRELMARMEWMADCLEGQLSPDFNTMADQLEAAMPPALSLEHSDDDFGHFIHALPGILAARHGVENHRPRAMELLYRATQRFSMEFYIRAFLIRWPEETLADLTRWASDENYHVRRLVSEGTRPRLPWAKAVGLSPEQTLPLLDTLHNDPTRYVTRSVANHLNDLSRSVPDDVVARLRSWHSDARQDKKELDWMTRHALRSLVKSGHAGALAALGYRSDVDVEARIMLHTPQVEIGHDLIFDCQIASQTALPLLVDYRIDFARPEGKRGQKVFKLKQGQTTPTRPFEVSKKHKLKAGATTFTWYPGTHRLILQVNGIDRTSVQFEVT